MSTFGQFLHTLVTDGLEYFGRFYSSYRGIVAENDDPEKVGRLKLVIPEVTGERTLGIWAWPKHNFSGQGFGSQCIPPIKTTVWVEFEQGNPKRPTWFHGHFGKGEKPESLSHIKNFWFKTPGGHLVEFDDNTNVIRLTHANGSKIVIKGGQVHLSAEDPLEVAPLGNELKAQLLRQEAKVQLIYDALRNSTTGTQDGGAAYKAGIVTILSTAQAPDYSNILSQKVKLE